MSTKSMIGIEKDNGRIDSIYCHNHGYPGHNGKLLKNHYNDKIKVKQLISNGNASYIASKISNCKFYKEKANVNDTYSNYFDLSSNIDYFYLYRDDQWYVLHANSDFKNLELLSNLIIN